jgi:hypothetical protein
VTGHLKHKRSAMRSVEATAESPNIRITAASPPRRTRYDNAACPVRRPECFVPQDPSDDESRSPPLCGTPVTSAQLNGNGISLSVSNASTTYGRIVFARLSANHPRLFAECNAANVEVAAL